MQQDNIKQFPHACACWQTTAVKVYHMLQPSLAGNLWPTLYTLRPLRHTGETEKSDALTECISSHQGERK